MSNCQRQKAPPLYIFIVVIPDGATSSPLYITRCNALLFLSRAIFGKPLAYAPLLYRFFLYFYYYYLFHKKLNNSLFPKPKTFSKKKTWNRTVSNINFLHCTNNFHYTGWFTWFFKNNIMYLVTFLGYS